MWLRRTKLATIAKLLKCETGNKCLGGGKPSTNTKTRMLSNRNIKSEMKRRAQQTGTLPRCHHRDAMQQTQKSHSTVSATQYANQQTSPKRFQVSVEHWCLKVSNESHNSTWNLDPIRLERVSETSWTTAWPCFEHVSTHGLTAYQTMNKCPTIFKHISNTHTATNSSKHVHHKVSNAYDRTSRKQVPRNYAKCTQHVLTKCSRTTLKPQTNKKL